jgi:hypothetical protein
MPVSQQLQHSHWVLLMRSVLEQRSGEGFLRWVLQQQPGLQHMDASNLTALLVLAAKHRRSSAVAVLAGLRAAQYLNAAAWAEVLMAAARAGEDTIPVLQDLPGVQQLGQGVVADALKTAVQDGVAAATAAISLLPAAQQLEPSVVANILETAAKQGAGSIKAVLTLPAAQELQPVVLVQALHALVAAIRNQACYDKTQRERVIAFRELCAHPLTQQVAAQSVQQLFDAATDMGTAGKQLLASLAQMPQAAGMQAKLSVSRLLPLLQQAIASGRCGWHYGEARDTFMRLLQEPAAQELGGADLVGLLRKASEQANDAAVAALQQLRGFQQLDSSDVWGLIRSILLGGWGVSYACMEGYIKHPAAAGFTVEQLTQLLSQLLQTGYGNHWELAMLMQLPCVQQVQAAAWEALICTCIRKSRPEALSLLLQQPGVRAIDRSGAERVMDEAMGRDSEEKYRAAVYTRAVVKGLPAVGQFTADEMLRLLWSTVKKGWESVAQALAEVPRFSEAAGQAGVEFAAMCASVRLLEGRSCPILPDADDA